MFVRATQRLSIPLLLIVAVLSSGCQELGVNQLLEERPAGAFDDTALQATTWRLIKMKTKQGSLTVTDVPKDPVLKLSVEAGRSAENMHKVSGNTGCNALSGEYTVEDRRLNFSKLVTTEIYCGEHSDAVEHALLGGLRTAETYELQGAELRIRSSDRVLIFEAAD